MRNLFLAMRPRQWVKNLFIFLPLIFGKKLFVFPENINTLFAFFLFSMASSSSYLINDIIDLEKDRFHPVKRLRMLASGKIMVKTALILSCILAAVSAIGSFALNPQLSLLMLAYLAGNILYSRYLKTIVIIDVFCLAGFFVLRIMAGTLTATVEFSYWMIFMIALLALFLGFSKRRMDLKLLKEDARVSRSVLAKYNLYFIDQMVAVLTSSIVVVYMLYTVSDRTVALFGSTKLIYTVPFVYYGIFRYLYMIHKIGAMEDPTKILFKDKIMALNIVLWILVCAVIIYL